MSEKVFFLVTADLRKGWTLEEVEQAVVRYLGDTVMLSEVVVQDIGYKEETT